MANRELAERIAGELFAKKDGFEIVAVKPATFGMAVEIIRLLIEQDTARLTQFKSLVHGTLDAIGIPTTTPEPQPNVDTIIYESGITESDLDSYCQSVPTQQRGMLPKTMDNRELSNKIARSIYPIPEYVRSWQEVACKIKGILDSESQPSVESLMRDPRWNHEQWSLDVFFNPYSKPGMQYEFRVMNFELNDYEYVVATGLTALAAIQAALHTQEKNMTGRRLPDNTDLMKMVAGDYAKVTDWPNPGDKPFFVGRAPTGEGGTFARTQHTFVEHDDGAITVTPSIWFNMPKGWHGFLERGVWRQA